MQAFALVDDPPEEEDKNECQELFPLTVYLMIFKLCIENIFLIDVYQKEILPCDFKRSGFIQFFPEPNVRLHCQIWREPVDQFAKICDSVVFM